MSCCGKKREQLAQQPLSNTVKSDVPQKLWKDELFEYTGNTALLVKGTISGKQYRFHFPGDRQLVDYRDVKSMMAIPALQKVKSD